MRRSTWLIAGAGVSLPLMLLALPLFLVVTVAATPPPTISCPGQGEATDTFPTSPYSTFAEVVQITRELGLPERAAIVYGAMRMRHGAEDLANGVRSGLYTSTTLPPSGVPGSWNYFNSDQQSPAPTPTLPARDFLQRLMQVNGWEAMSIPDAVKAVDPTALPITPEYEQMATDSIHPLWEAAATTSTTVDLGSCGTGHTRAAIVNGYTLPVDLSWWQAHPDWFTKPHHDYASADIPVPGGTTVYAAAAGKVVTAPAGGDCGEGVIIESPDGIWWTYCHGEKPLVPQGVEVQAGDAIMISGCTGHCDGAHLHFQIKVPALPSDTSWGDPLVCPQNALVAWAQARSIDVRTLPRMGCVG